MAPISNPFGTAIFHWDSKPFKFEQTEIGEYVRIIKPLRDHIAKHLFDKVYNQKHDEEVARLKEAGRDKEARSFRLGIDVENKIWLLITGEPKYKDNGELLQKEDPLDLTALDKAVKSIEQKANAVPNVRSVSTLIEQAQNEALMNTSLLDKNEVIVKKGSKGSARLNEEKKVEDPLGEAVEAAASNGEVTEGQVDPEPKKAVEKQAGDFSDLQNLE